MQARTFLLSAILALLVGLYPWPAFAQKMAHVTSVTAEVEPPQFVGSCPRTFKFTGVITVNRAGRVKYRWEHSDGKHRMPSFTTFSSPAAHTVRDAWMLGSSSAPFHYPGFARLRILQPNPTASGKATFTLDCVPRSAQKKSPPPPSQR